MKNRRITVALSLVVALSLAVFAGCAGRCGRGPFAPQAVRERIAIDSGQSDSYIYYGYDLRFYSDDHATEIHRIDSAGGAQFSAPTAVATATPALLVNNAGVSKIADFQDGGTSQLEVLDGGGVQVAAPTAVATAQPALQVDSAGVSNILEIRDAATPVFAVNNGGDVVGNLLQYGSSGEKAVASTESITGTATVAHGLTTVTWALCVLGEDPTSGAGDAAHVSVAISANVVTAKVWQDDFVTAATETDVAVHCLVIGTP